MTQVTQLLSAIDTGDRNAADELLPLVYEELRRLAAQKLAHEQAGQTLQATDLVHEAFLRLIGPGNSNGFAGSKHFFAAAAEAMRRVLVDRARAKQCQKRGNPAQRIPLDDFDAVAPDQFEKVLLINDALDVLAQSDAPAADLVKLRYFAGMTILEAASVLDITPRAADLLWAYARSWLLQHLKEE